MWAECNLCPKVKRAFDCADVHEIHNWLLVLSGDKSYRISVTPVKKYGN